MTSAKGRHHYNRFRCRVLFCPSKTVRDRIRVLAMAGTATSHEAYDLGTILTEIVLAEPSSNLNTN
jgi:hypothetical protein